MRTKEQVAGDLYCAAREDIRKSDTDIFIIANHIHLMANGTIDFDGPLWKDQILEPDKLRVRPDSFEDYLLKPEPEGLGLKSLNFLNSLIIQGHDGPRTLEILRREIPDYDKKVELAKRKEELKLLNH